MEGTKDDEPKDEDEQGARPLFSRTSPVATAASRREIDIVTAGNYHASNTR